ncbi:cation channel sperm-associated protein 4 isoform X2 [Monodelphis domestica]|uniref:cation channel sperm-associated protein 4 isoform X2 n=1 Tax=Monodelphis domestica TaxID=13616 RepID=UPI0024E1FD81|nr:cation channel sperm-associated protein 4 isoform X2 [Monodelphis domestica]
MNESKPEWTHWDTESGRPVNFVKGGGLKESYGRPEEKVLINRREVTITRDAWDMQEFITYMYIRQLLRHPVFQALLAILLVANAITIALRTNSHLGQENYELFSAIDDIVLTILMCEVLLGWFNGFWIFWKDGWNMLNFVIVFGLVLGLFFDIFDNIAITYTLRALRLMHVCMAIEPLARILRVIIQSLPDMANIMALILFFMLLSKEDYLSTEKPELQLVHCQECLTDWSGTAKQEPLSGGPMENLNENTCDNFCLVLEGIQENLRTYKKIREELNSLVEEVRSIRFNQEHEEEVMHRSWKRSLSQDDRTSVHSQDVLTALINKDKAQESSTMLYGKLKTKG